MDFLPDATKLYSYLIGLDSVGIKAIFSTIVAIIGYCKAKKYVEERTFEIFYFLFAILSLTPSILVQFKPFNEIKIGQFITISFIFLFCFGSLAYLSLMRYSKFFWAKKLLDGIV